MIATIEMVAVCFMALTKTLRQTTTHQLVSDHKFSPSFDYDVDGLFVTWYKGKELRGCIGTLRPINLQHGLTEYALVAALEDTRFEPVTNDEIETLECKVSILFSFERCESWNDWTIGTHGIIVRFNSGGKSYSATLLPDVMVEQEWSLETAILKAIQKSGYPHHVQSVDALVKTVLAFSVVRYQSSVASMTYSDFLQLKADKP